MVFLGGPRQAAGRRYILSGAATCAALLFMGAVALVGCGGGGSDNPDPNATPTPNPNAIVRGRVIDDTTRENVAGVVIRIGDVRATTNSEGRYEIQLPGGGGARILFVEFPNGQFSRDGSLAGAGGCLDLVSDGIEIVATNLESGDEFLLNDIEVYNTAVGPPAPPCTFD